MIEEREKKKRTYFSEQSRLSQTRPPRTIWFVEKCLECYFFPVVECGHRPRRSERQLHERRHPPGNGGWRRPPHTTLLTNGSSLLEGNNTVEDLEYSLERGWMVNCFKTQGGQKALPTYINANLERQYFLDNYQIIFTACQY
ncbi:hypothetical protein CEXT_814531 [Caerostris extrusa]|uniref:Uncharacterized protein n=1 Tax=Caerostris extrusa TaxID=172846 RepID=A0AAV4MKC4_CAEEX|nr:hypothetical protein CEXT_814531 [Caerostris extrusa]